MMHPALDSLANQLQPIPAAFRDQLSPATHFMDEWREYFVSLDGVQQLLVSSAKTLHPVMKQDGASIFRVCIENSLGLACFQPLANEQPVGDPLWVEVISPKFPTIEAHLSFCQTIIADLFAQAARLPFDFANQTQRGVIETLQPPTPIFTYHFLIQSLAAFRSAIELVIAQPYRVLSDQADQVLLHEASEVDGDVIVNILQSPETWVPTNGFDFSPALQVNGVLYAPQKVWQWLPEETFDTPENRFVLHFLRQVLTVAETLPLQSWWSHVQNLAEARAIQELTSMLRRAVSHPMFDDVGTLHTVPFHSQVLMRREGYRDLMILWQQFQNARSPLFGIWEEAIDLRAVYQLYELWVLFRLIREIEGFSPLERLSLPWSDENGVEHGAQAVFQDGSKLLYNKIFRPHQKKNRSYSMTLRPDYVWVGNGRQVVLDAKFSMNIIELVPEDDATDGDPDSILPKVELPVQENLYKMHTYRDALVGTQAAVIVYPGNQPVFMPTQGKCIHDFTLQEVLIGKHPLPDGGAIVQMDGIGAICMKPGTEK